MITDAPGKGLRLTVCKLGKDREVKEELYSKTFDPKITKELRLYISKGEDSLLINTHSKIKVRVIGKGKKSVNVIESGSKVELYADKDNALITGEISAIRKHISADSMNTAFMAQNPYNAIKPMLMVGYNVDDGILLGPSVKIIRQGFRKKPYASMQQITFLHAFNPNSYRLRYHGEWLGVLGKADFVTNARVYSPNVQNFFGMGNGSEFDKDNHTIKYYRARFDVYQVDPAIRWKTNEFTSLSIGPSFQYYHFDKDGNKGRFINNSSELYSHDRDVILNDKLFAGAVANLTVDRRNNKLLPTNGGYMNVKVQGYKGLNDASGSFVQLIPEICMYKALNQQSSIVIANRIGGGIGIGKMPFYQSMFLGGHENLLGFRQYRFAGQHMVYNNFELRLKLAKIGSYILPGQLGMIGFYDAGRVWADENNSSTMHQGVGGGIYFAPAQMLVLQVLVGHSTEGWFPMVTTGFRF